MGKIRRGNYVFTTSIGDHRPRQVHVYKDSRLVVKWDLESNRPMSGRPTARIVALIQALQAEGAL